MIIDAAKSQADAAALVMERNRVELRAVFSEPADGPADVFPRSATLRWVLARLTPRAIAWTALTTVMARVPFGHLLGSALFGRRR